MIKNRFSTWALNASDDKILIALELNTDSLQVDIKTLKATEIDQASTEFILKNWVAGEFFLFPDTAVIYHTNFTDDSILPLDIKIDEKSGAIRQLQNEWSYLLLNLKLYEQFNIKLDEIKIKAASLQSYNHDVFQEAKEFWEDVLNYRKEKEINQHKMNAFKEEINQVFDHLKRLKENMQKEIDEKSSKIKEEYDQKLAEINTKLENNSESFKKLMDDLIQLQNNLKSIDIKRSIKQSLYDAIQTCFETIKKKRNNSFGSYNSGKIENLKTALDRIQKSFDIDKKDLDFNNKKLQTANNKLEQQLREAKQKVIEDRMASKEEKIIDIKKTIEKLEKKSTKQKEIVETKPKDDIENQNQTSIDSKEDIPNIVESTLIDENYSVTYTNTEHPE